MAAPVGKLPPIADVLQLLPKRDDKTPPKETFTLPEDAPAEDTAPREALSLAPTLDAPMSTETFLSLLESGSQNTSSTGSTSGTNTNTGTSSSSTTTGITQL
jgi:hypothetical protein